MEGERKFPTNCMERLVRRTVRVTVKSGILLGEYPRWILSECGHHGCGRAERVRVTRRLIRARQGEAAEARLRRRCNRATEELIERSNDRIIFERPRHGLADAADRSSHHARRRIRGGHDGGRGVDRLCRLLLGEGWGCCHPKCHRQRREERRTHPCPRSECDSERFRRAPSARPADNSVAFDSVKQKINEKTAGENRRRLRKLPVLSRLRRLLGFPAAKGENRGRRQKQCECRWSRNRIRRDDDVGQFEISCNASTGTTV